jgi:hypothetical protein
MRVCLDEIRPVKRGVIKRIVLCFDGTSNEPEDGEQDRSWLGLGGPEDSSITNVLKLHLLFGGDLQGNNVFPDQLSFYYPGVGTYGSWLDRIKNMAFAPPDEDVGDLIKHASRDLYKTYQPGDQVYLFGFSRGAAIARRFAGVLKETFQALDKECPEITFMGVFDTVAALKQPNIFKDHIKPASDVVFENGTVSNLVKKALHVVSLDDRRIAFYPTLMNQQEGVVDEIWMCGAHADVGGGYRHDGLSDIALSFLIDYIDDNGIDLRKRPAIDIEYDDLFDGPDEYISYEDVNVQPNYMGKNHEQEARSHLRGKMLSFRTPRINIYDKHSVHSPLIHHTVLERIRDDPKYVCEPLLNRMVNPYTGEKVGLKVWYGKDHVVSYDTLEAALADAQIADREMEVGETRAVTAYANLKFNVTGIKLPSGSSLVFKVRAGQKWYDAEIECGPEGWDADKEIENRVYRWGVKLSERRRRYPEAEWFELTACLNKDLATCFKVLNHTTKAKKYLMTQAGSLYLFANDLKSKYGNNRGSLTVEVTRVD